MASTALQTREDTSKAPNRSYRWLLYAAAVLFAAATVLYSAAWMYFVRQPPPPSPKVEVGFDASYSSAGIEVDRVYPGSPA